MNEYLELLDWRRRVAELWAAWRAAAPRDPAAATQAFRAARDRLFREHPQSPLSAAGRRGFAGLVHWAYDEDWRLSARLERDAGVPGPHADAPALAQLPRSGPPGVALRRIGTLHLSGPLAGRRLGAYWLEGYGGGLFVAFRDATSGAGTYGAGRYLLDTAKGADHGPGARPDELLLDFNMAYHPSCAYDPRWDCPLAPLENRLDLLVTVGEKLPG